MSSLTSRYYGPRPGLSQQHSLLVQKHSLSLSLSLSQYLYLSAAASKETKNIQMQFPYL